MGEKKIIGMFGGKFVPMHMGHETVVRRAFLECDVVYLCLFLNSPAEKKVREQWYTHPDFRYYQLKKAADRIQRELRMYYARSVKYDILVIDCNLYEKDGEEDWDAEAEYITNIAGRIDRVYSSEPSYGPTFKRIYPAAEHVIVTKLEPISATALRDMDLDDMIGMMV